MLPDAFKFEHGMPASSFSKIVRTMVQGSSKWPRHRDQPTGRDGGFALVELMMVILVISLLGAIAVPALARVQRRARAAAVANDFRVFAAAFCGYAQETGKWPDETGTGVLPAVMKNRINAGSWTQKTPVGGKYDWESNRRHRGVRYRAAIAIAAASDSPLNLDVPQLLALDQTLDDGDLNLGNFRLGARSKPLFIIEK